MKAGKSGFGKPFTGRHNISANPNSGTTGLKVLWAQYRCLKNKEIKSQYEKNCWPPLQKLFKEVSSR